MFGLFNNVSKFVASENAVSSIHGEETELLEQSRSEQAIVFVYT